MEHLDPPSPELWDQRRAWFETLDAQASRQGAGRLSEQAMALMIELQAVFCCGAWAAAVVLSAAVVEMQTESSKERRAASPKDLAWLRGLRNRLVHEDQGEPALTIEDQWTRRPEWEGRARRAVEIVFQVLYARGEEQGGMS